VTLTDELPDGVASWQLTDDGGGIDKSVGDTVIVEGLALLPKQAVDVVLELVVDEVADLTEIVNVAELAGDGGPVQLMAPALVVRRDGDADGVFDGDDNCPEAANADQADADRDGVGDTCEAAGTGGEASSGEASGSSSAGSSGEVGTGAGEVGTGTGGGTGAGAGTGGADSDTPTGGGGGGSTAADASSTGASAGVDGDGGCGCRSVPAPAGGLSLLLLLLRRRRD